MSRETAYYNTSASVQSGPNHVRNQCDDRGHLLVASALPVVNVGATLTRPADTTAYASGDLVANSTTAGSVVPIAFSSVPRGSAHPVRIRRVRIKTSSTNITNAAFRVHLFKGSGTITCANGDNGAISTDGAADYLGSVDVTVGQAFTDGAFGAATADIVAVPTATSLYGLIEARGAYTPTSGGTFIVSLELDQL